ncbi:MAG: hypothetical protein HUU06_08785 [Planctomycetaceae bacterium]|nr:hypothetical protein [Planctomycetaceae bacterium]
MRVLGVPWGEVEEAGRLDALHVELLAERTREDAGRKGKDSIGCRMATILLFWPCVAVWYAAPALLAGLAAVASGILGIDVPESTGGWLRGGMVLCAVLSMPVASSRDAGKLDSFLALRIPSRRALYLRRLSRAGTRTLLACLAWASSVGILLLAAGAPPAVLLPCSLAGGLLPAVVVLRLAWGRAVDPATESIDFPLLPLVITVLTPRLLAVIAEVASTRPSRSVLLLFLLLYGLVPLLINGIGFLRRLRRGPLPPGAWGRPLLGGTSLLFLAAAGLGVATVAIEPAAVVGLPGGAAPLAGWGTVLGATLLGLLLLRGGIRDFESREVLAAKEGGSSSPFTPAKAGAVAEPFPPRSSSLVEARLRIMGTIPLLGHCILYSGLGLLAFVSVLHRFPLFYIMVFTMLIPWGELKEPGRAWLLGMDLRDQRRHDRWMGVVVQGPLLLGLTALAIPLAGGGPERWALLPFLFGVMVLRTGSHGGEALLRSRGLRSFGARILVYVLMAAILLAPMAGPRWILIAAAVATAAGLLGLLLEQRIVREADLRKEMLDRAETA